jgi:hypothetical protein
MALNPDYTLEGAKWGRDASPGTPGEVVTFSFASSNYDGQPFTYDAPLDPAFQVEARNAFAEWSSLANITFEEVVDSPVSNIRIGWEPIDGPYKSLGLTYYTVQDGHLLNAWIGLDHTEPFVSGDASGPLLDNGVPFRAIVEHEIGHAIGLGHYDASPALMNSLLSVTQIQIPDVDAVQALYGAAPPPAPGPVAAASMISGVPAGDTSSPTSTALAAAPSGSALLADMAKTADIPHWLHVATSSHDETPPNLEATLEIPRTPATAHPDAGSARTDPTVAAVIEALEHHPEPHHNDEWFHI